MLQRIRVSASKGFLEAVDDELTLVGEKHYDLGRAWATDRMRNLEEANEKLIAENRRLAAKLRRATAWSSLIEKPHVDEVCLARSRGVLTCTNSAAPYTHANDMRLSKHRRKSRTSPRKWQHWTMRRKVNRYTLAHQKGFPIFNASPRGMLIIIYGTAFQLPAVAVVVRYLELLQYVPIADMLAHYL